MSDVILSTKLEELSQCREIETFCVTLVYEFLLCNNFNRTIQVLTEEIQSSQFSLPEQLPLKKERIQKDDVIKIISAIEMEDHLQFFERWTDLVPTGIKNLTEYKNITLPLYTYFATLPMRREKKSSVETKEIRTEEVTLSNEQNQINLDDSLKEINEISDEKDSLNQTFIISKPTLEGNTPKISYASDRDLEIEPDSLESEMEASDNEQKTQRKKILSAFKAHEEQDTIVVFDAGKQDPNIEVINNEDAPKNNEESANTNENIELEDNGPSAMTMFQEFLLEKKYSFNTEPQYLPLFALPFIQNPEEHEAFNQLFQDKWVGDLKESLHSFLIKYSCGDSVVPQIVKICRENRELKSVAKKNSETSEDYSKLYKEARRKMHKLKRDHKSLVGVASELASALENSVRGEAVDIKSTIFKCVSIFPELFPHTKGPESLLTNGEIPEKGEKGRLPLGPSQLDSKKMKEDLSNGSIKLKLLLLQALRWEICSARSEDRETLVSWLGREDLLGLQTPEGYGREWLSSSEAHPLQQSVARLLNCIASLRTGRDYIGECNPPLAPVVVASVLRVSGQDRLTQDMLLALLQKLSLRKEMCEDMVHHGLLDWLSGRLSQCTSLYQLEYTASLFMNLSIHAPVTYWDTRPHQVLPGLLKLITTPHQQVLEFVLGSLYCLLRSDKLNIFARSLGLSAELSNVTSQRCHRQVAALLKLHRRELSPAAVQLTPPQATEEDIEDPEEIETEVNADDLVKGSPSGQQLLAQRYSLLFTTPSIVGHGSEGRLRLRPSTPRAIHSLPAWAL